jgi:hypothetical protein
MRGAAAVVMVSRVAMLTAASASADILAGPDATKLCAGYDGGGIRWSIWLNEGWRESRLIHYRATLIDPHGRRSNLRYGKFGGYWDYGNVTRRYEPNTLPNPVVGIYRFILEVGVDHRYPDIQMVGRRTSTGLIRPTDGSSTDPAAGRFASTTAADLRLPHCALAILMPREVGTVNSRWRSRSKRGKPPGSATATAG